MAGWVRHVERSVPIRAAYRWRWPHWRGSARHRVAGGVSPFRRLLLQHCSLQLQQHCCPALEALEQSPSALSELQMEWKASSRGVSLRETSWPMQTRR